MGTWQVETHFAPAARTSPEDVHRRVTLLAGNPVTDTLLRTVGGLMVIVDHNRQIVAVNETLLDTLGISDATTLLGLRPGEALSCVHAHEEPHGCGTTRHCATCGAVIAIVSAFAQDQAQERHCVMEIASDEGPRDLVLRVRACPLVVAGERFVLLFLQDVTDEQRLASLEKIFYHDLNNILQGLTVASDLVKEETDDEELRILGRQIERMVKHLAREVQLQRSLHGEDIAQVKLSRSETPVATIMDEIRSVFLHHPAAEGKTLLVATVPPDATVYTDLWLLVRILSNLVVNAFEATEPGGVVEVRAQFGPRATTLHVRSPAAIPREIQPRIFQKNFTTKASSGHGLGTYAARLFGETLLDAQVDFTSSDRDGTDFFVRLPLRQTAGRPARREAAAAGP